MHASILVVMDHFPKMAHFIPSSKSRYLVHVAKPFLREVVGLPRLQKSIVSAK